MPFAIANLDLVRYRVGSPSWAIISAAPRVPIPRISTRVVPDVATSWAIWRLSSAICLIRSRRVRTRWRAMSARTLRSFGYEPYRPAEGAGRCETRLDLGLIAGVDLGKVGVEAVDFAIEGIVLFLAV